MAGTVPMIAAAFNNEVNLTRWDKLDDCLFLGYKNFTMQEWNRQENREEGGDLRFKRIGKRWSSLTFPIMYEQEFKYILDNFTDGEEDGYVTINVYNRDEMRWMIANAHLKLPEDRKFNIETGYYENIVIEFREIVEIVA